MFRASYTPPWSSTPAMLACELQSVFLTDFPLLWPRFREVSVYDYILLHSITARVPALTLRPVSLLSLTRCKATEALLLTMENRARAAESKLIAGEPPSPFVRLHDPPFPLYARPIIGPLLARAFGVPSVTRIPSFYDDRATRIVMRHIACTRSFKWRWFCPRLCGWRGQEARARVHRRLLRHDALRAQVVSSYDHHCYCFYEYENPPSLWYKGLVSGIFGLDLL